MAAGRPTGRRELQQPADIGSGGERVGADDDHGPPLCAQPGTPYLVTLPILDCRVMLGAVVLDSDPGVRVGQIETVRRHAVHLDPPLDLRRRQTEVVHLESGPRLSLRLGARIDQGDELAQLDHPAPPPVAGQGPDQLGSREPMSPQQSVHRCQGLAPVEATAEVQRRTQRGGDLHAVDLDPVTGHQVTHPASRLGPARAMPPAEHERLQRGYAVELAVRKRVDTPDPGRRTVTRDGVATHHACGCRESHRHRQLDVTTQIDPVEESAHHPGGHRTSYPRGSEAEPGRFDQGEGAIRNAREIHAGGLTAPAWTRTPQRVACG